MNTLTPPFLTTTPVTCTMKPISMFVPFTNITRFDDEARIVEGYCYVNARVGDGFNLKRKAMERASADYMKWGAIREMHGSNAAGTAVSAIWDSVGCLLKARIVDDTAWKKVKEGVYKGFSVGVAPKVVRGEDVEECLWYENSLVDRPADPDAKFTLVHKADFDPTKDVEVVVLPAITKEERQQKNARKLERLNAGKDQTMKKTDLKSDNPVIQRMIVALPDTLGPDDVTKILIERQAAEDKAGHTQAELTRVEGEKATAITERATAITERAAAITRAEAAETLATEQGKKLIKRKAKITALEAQVSALEQAPGVIAPLRYENGVKRQLSDGKNPLLPADENEANKQASALLKEFTDLQATLSDEPSQVKRIEGASKLSYIGSQLNELGVETPI